MRRTIRAHVAECYCTFVPAPFRAYMVAGPPLIDLGWPYDV